MFEKQQTLDASDFAFTRVDPWIAASRVRWLAIVGILILSLLLGFLSGARLFSLAVAGLSVMSGLTPWRVILRKPLRIWLYAVIAIGTGLYHLILPIRLPIDDPLFFPVESHLIARIFMMISVVTLYLQQERDRPPLWLAGIGALCLPFAVNLPLGYSKHHTLVYGIVAYVGVLAVYSNEWRVRIPGTSWRRLVPRGILLLTTLTLSLLTGAASAYALQKYEKHIELYLEDLLGYESRTVRPGFTIGNRLNDVSNWKTTRAEDIALRAYSDHEPGYLRGIVFDTYRTPRDDATLTVWSGQVGSYPLRAVTPPRGLPDVAQERRMYSVIDHSQGPWSTIEVWRQNTEGPFLFAPQETAYVSVGIGMVFREFHGSLRSSELQGQVGYSLITTQSLPPQKLSTSLHELTTTVEPHLSPRIRQLAEELFVDCDTTQAKIARVQQWFRTEFEYRLGIDVPRRADPLTYFLIHREPAHCEFFATGTAILLRLAGVPTRYVAGYVAAERNDVGGYWIARNKDAHAWVEAYDDALQQWVIVESTPEAGIPHPRGASNLSQSLDTIQLMWARLRDSIRSDGLELLFQRAWSILWSIPGLITLTLVLLLPLLLRIRRLTPWVRHRDDAHLKSMHAVLSKLDKQSKIHFRERLSGETLMQFADDLRTQADDLVWSSSLADCYDLYTTLRFRSQTGSDAVEQLELALARVPLRQAADMTTKPSSSSLNSPISSQ